MPKIYTVSASLRKRSRLRELTNALLDTIFILLYTGIILLATISIYSVLK
jgi:hypothetical protein